MFIESRRGVKTLLHMQSWCSSFWRWRDRWSGWLGTIIVGLGRSSCPTCCIIPACPPPHTTTPPQIRFRSSSDSLLLLSCPSIHHIYSPNWLVNEKSLDGFMLGVVFTYIKYVHIFQVFSLNYRIIFQTTLQNFVLLFLRSK